MPYFLDCYIDIYNQHKSCCRNQFALPSATQTNRDHSFKKISYKLVNTVMINITPPRILLYHMELQVCRFYGSSHFT